MLEKEINKLKKLMERKNLGFLSNANASALLA